MEPLSEDSQAWLDANDGNGDSAYHAAVAATVESVQLNDPAGAQHFSEIARELLRKRYTRGERPTGPHA